MIMAACLICETMMTVNQVILIYIYIEKTNTTLDRLELCR